MPGRLVGVAEAAKLCKRSSETIRRWARAGKLRALEARGAHNALSFLLGQVEERMVDTGALLPEYHRGEHVMCGNELAVVVTFRPSYGGYLLHFGHGRYEWHAELALAHV